jgi:hypothetical protein
MSRADIATLVIAAIYLVVQVFMCIRFDHYVKTGRWFR